MQDNNLYVGAASRPLEYPEGFFPHKSFRGRYFTGVHDDLHVRTIYIRSSEEVLLISLELGDIGDQWLGAISEATGVPEANIFLSASHTHSAPHIHATIREDVIDIEMGEKFGIMARETVLECAKAAVEGAQKATVSIASGKSDLNINRDYKCEGPDAPSAPYIQAPSLTGPTDKTLDVVIFKAQDTGKQIAVLVNYPIHSIVTFYQTWDYTDSMLVTSDLTGNAMSYVEAHCDEDTVSMFTMAAAGDQIPKFYGNHRTFGKNGAIGWEYYGREVSFALCDAQGSLFGREVLQLMEAAEDISNQTEISISHVTISPMGKVEGWNVSETSFTDEVKNDGNSMADQYKESAIPDFHYTPTEKIDVKMGMMKFGNLNFVFVPAELVSPIGADIKKAVSEIIPGHTLVVTQCNGAFSYMVDDYGYDEKTFEAIASHFMPGIAAELTEGVRKMAEMIKDKEEQCDE